MSFSPDFKLPEPPTKEWLEENYPRELRDVETMLAKVNNLFKKIEWKE